MAGDTPSVRALAVNGTDLYAAGLFTKAGGVSVNRIAKWDGGGWSPLGSGLGGPTYPDISALAVSGTNLYVGGYFTTAGNIVSAYVAKANLSGATPVAPVFTSIVPNPSGTQALLTFTCDPGASFHLLSSRNLTTWQTNTTVNTIGATNSVLINVTQPYEFFRLRGLP